MNRLTFSDLTELLRECAGDPEEGTDLGQEEALDTPFLEFGYDSLALLQVTGLLQRRYGVTLADEAVVEAETPRLLLQVINGSLSAGSTR